MPAMSDRSLTCPPGVFRATVAVPGDKSLSHRALIFAALAAGRSAVSGLGPGADVAATAAALERLGATIGDGAVDSPGVARWIPADGVLDAGNSGTTLRLLAGALAGRPFRSTLDGDDSLRRRPMRRLVGPLTALGAGVETSADGTAPVTVWAPKPLHGAAIEIGIASAQVRSAAALAALQADGATTIDSPPGFRDHTERWLEALARGKWVDATAFRVDPGPVPAGEYRVPADPSSAAYLWAAAALRPGAAVVTPGVSLNPGRIGFLDVVRRFGADVDAEVTGDVLGDPVGVVQVRGGGLAEVDVGGSLAVRALDELPLVGILAAAGEGVTKVSDAAELRAKETDRIAATVAMIRALGGTAVATEDGFVVEGAGGLRGGRVDAAGDHRIAMAAAVAAVACRDGVLVSGAEAAAVSWPEAYEVLETLWSSR